MLKRKKEKFNLRKQKGWLAGSSATQTICVSFLLVIAAGTLLLSLPIASKQGRLGLVDALFTATSATCVTGLVVRDTWTQFTFFGQAVLLLLIQVGGLGLVTLTSFFALAARRRMGFRDLRLLGESVSAEGLSKATEWFMPMAQKNDRRGANVSTLMPAFTPVRRYSRPSASV